MTEVNQVVILAGGLGTRLSEETVIRPKPLVEIGGRPILWHIINYYRKFGKTRFLVLAGYMGDEIKRYFAGLSSFESDIRVSFPEGKVERLETFDLPDYTIEIIDTGLETMTGGRLSRARKFLDPEFHLTYGDGLSSVDIAALEATHRRSTHLVTLSAVQPIGRFGALTLNHETGSVSEFREKAANDDTYVNGGFMVCHKSVLDYISGDDVVLEQHPFEMLASDGKLGFFEHNGFWQPMDTMKDKRVLESIWQSGENLW